MLYIRIIVVCCFGAIPNNRVAIVTFILGSYCTLLSLVHIAPSIYPKEYEHKYGKSPQR